MRNITWLEPAKESDGPSLALSSALRYVIAAHRGHATDDYARLFGTAVSHAKACGATDTDITHALRGAQ
jgi:hypothetical protein